MGWLVEVGWGCGGLTGQRGDASGPGQGENGKTH